MHAVKPVRSPFSSPHALQLALLTSPTDHLSADLAAVQPCTLALQLASKAYPLELYRVHAVKSIRSPFSSPLGLQLELRLLTSPTDHLSTHLVAVQTSTLLLQQAREYTHARYTSCMLSSQSDHLSAHLLACSCRLLTSPADHLSVHLVDVSPKHSHCS